MTISESTQATSNVSNTAKKALLVGVATLGLALSIGVVPASAQTTTTTAPATVLDPMKEGANDMDDLAGLGAALAISSTVFGAGALMFKRFIYS